MKKAFLFAMTFTGTFIGAGFATGQEIMSFFVLKNPRGVIFYIFSCFLMTLVCKKVAESGKENVISFYCELLGKAAGKIVFFVALLSLFCCFAATVTAFGSLLSDAGIMSFYEGVIIFAFISVCICNHGIGGLYAVNSILTPFIIFFSIIFGVISALNPQVQSVMSFNGAGEHLFIPLWYGILYAGYNVFSLIPVSLGSGKVGKSGYVIAFLLISVSGAAVFLSIASNLHFAMLYELPFFETVSRISAFSEKIYFFVLVFSLVTTASSCLYGFVSGMEALGRIKRKHIYFFCAAGLAVILPLGLSGIVRKIYPLFGAAGTAVIIGIWLKKLKK